MKMFKEAEVFITRRCNLACDYCVIPEDKRLGKTELLIDDWKKAFDNLEALGIKQVIILGGEPTLKPGFEGLINYISKKNIDIAVSTNGVVSPLLLRKLLDAGMKNIIVSIDGIYESPPGKPEKCGYSAFKSYYGLKLLKDLRSKGHQGFLGANVVVSKETLPELLHTYEVLSSNGIWINLCPVQWLKYGPKEKCPSRLEEADRKEMNRIMGILIEQKRSEGNNNSSFISNSIAYLENFSDLAIYQNYKCCSPEILTVLEDGNIWYCIGQEGEIGKGSKFNITTFDKNKAEEFYKMWPKDKIGSVCRGCTFSCRDRTGEFNNLSKSTIHNYWFDRLEEK